ncbi:MAG: putative cytokinetic ring protein SteA [Nocardioidaceae bacterium]
MKLSSLYRSRSHARSGITGVGRLDRRTQNLARRLQPGEIAVIDHIDIDRAAAVGLVEAGAAAVINLAPSISGRYPNLGPDILVKAGVPLVDDVGGELFMAINDGDQIRIDGDTIYHGDSVVATGVRQSRESVTEALERSKAGLPSQLEAFTANAVEHLRRERDLLLEGKGVPTVTTQLSGRHVLVVLRAFDYKADLKSLKTYLKENSPILIGVDSGADALLEAGLRPDLIVGDTEEVTDAALRCGAEIVAHASLDGRIRGADRLERLGVTHATFASGGTGHDIALLLAHANDAALIVQVGTPSSLIELVDNGRSSMASAFLTKASVGSRVVDAKAVAQLYRTRLRGWVMFLLVLLAIVVVVAAIATTPVGQDWWSQIKDWCSNGYDWVQGRTG